MNHFRFLPKLPSLFFFFFNDTATTEIYTLSLHDALPICSSFEGFGGSVRPSSCPLSNCEACRDRKSTRLNSSHVRISYAVFCLKKKNKKGGGPVGFVSGCSGGLR